MNGGVKSLLMVASLAAAGCASEPGTVEVRPIVDPGSKLRPGDGLLADAKGQFALGNVGLALEGFRKAARERPDSAEALAGMGLCYDAMGRYDLAQAKYEAALALAPRNPTLLTALAASLDRQGNRDAAAEVRNEIAQLASASAALDQAVAEVEPAPAPAPLAPAQSVTVSLPPAQSVTVALPPPQLAARADVALASTGRIERMNGAALAANVYVAMPEEPPAARMPAPRLSEQAQVDLRTAAEPRLERLSFGEVALVTIQAPVWRGQVVARSPQSVTVRWVPLQTASARPNIRLLNAARRQGLAARSREYLLGRGWRKIEIGDSTELRDQSVVLYPAARQALGRSLAAQFGFRARPSDNGNVLVILLGRDAAGARAMQTRG
jgi:tetratricopeptide (TPR) repeat protein